MVASDEVAMDWGDAYASTLFRPYDFGGAGFPGYRLIVQDDLAVRGAQGRVFLQGCYRYRERGVRVGARPFAVIAPDSLC